MLLNLLKTRIGVNNPFPVLISSFSLMQKSPSNWSSRTLCYRLNLKFGKMPKVAQKVVFVLGPPGVGKGTQCLKISEKFDFAHVSAGDLLRQERQTPGSQYGDLIESCIKEGKIVPAEITCMLLEKFLENSEKNKVLVDGFPRNEDNREEWFKIIGDKVEILFILYIECPVEVCIERCLHRGATAGNDRVDDTVEILQKRINTHIRETQPTVDHFARANMVKIVDGNQSEDEVFQNIVTVFNNCGLKPKDL